MDHRGKFAGALLIAAMGAPFAAWGSVGLGGFTVEPSVPGTQLFLSVGTSSAGAVRTADRTWPVMVDLDLLATLPSQFVVNFPDRTPVSLVRARSEAHGTGSYTWIGDGDSCSGVFTAFGGAMQGTLHCSNGTYGVRVPRTGGHQLVRYDPAQIPDENEPESLPNVGPPTPEETAHPLPALQGSDNVIDVLVLYTPGVVNRYSNFTDGLVHARLDAQAAVNDTQQVMDHSHTNAQVRLVHSQLVDRLDSSDLGAVLVFLSSDATVDAARNYWAADIVVLLTNLGSSPSPCGQAFIPGFNGQPLPGPAFAPFSVALVATACAGGEVLTFAHELSHTLGANHNHQSAQIDNPTPIAPWAWGHCSPTSSPDMSKASYRTVMSYNSTGCTPAGHPSLRQPYYSNATMSFVDGSPMGVADLQENYRVVRDVAPIAAQYRASLGRIFADGFEP